MEFTTEEHGEVLIVKPIGRLDARAVEEAERRLMGALNDRVRIAIDMSELASISSAGLRVLLKVAKQVKSGDGKLALFALRPNVRHVFSVSAFDTILPLHADRATALAALA